MKYNILSFIRGLIASITAFFVSIGGFLGNTEEPKEPLPENQIFAYSEDTADYLLNIDPEEEIHDISDLLFGIFFEDINFAADGGLYGEMVVNRSFQYTELAADDELYGWNTVGNADNEVIKADKENYLNINNTNYLVIKNTSTEKAGIENRGFLDGMAVEGGKNYNFSVYAKALDGYKNKDVALFEENTNLFLSIIEDIDRLLLGKE